MANTHQHVRLDPQGRDIAWSGTEEAIDEHMRAVHLPPSNMHLPDKPQSAPNICLSRIDYIL